MSNTRRFRFYGFNTPPTTLSAHSPLAPPTPLPPLSCRNRRRQLPPPPLPWTGSWPSKLSPATTRGCAQYREITRWFPSLAMLRNHAHGLVKVMIAAEKQRAFPAGRTIPPATILPWAMREVQRSPDPRQRARWWMYRSSTTPPTATDDITDAVLALPAPINNAY